MSVGKNFIKSSEIFFVSFKALKLSKIMQKSESGKETQTIKKTKLRYFWENENSWKLFLISLLSYAQFVWSWVFATSNLFLYKLHKWMSFWVVFSLLLLSRSRKNKTHFVHRRDENLISIVTFKVTSRFSLWRTTFIVQIAS